MEDFNLALHRFTASMPYNDGLKYEKIFSSNLTNQECECSFCLPAVFHTRARVIESLKRPANALERSQRLMVLPPPLISTSPVKGMLLCKDDVMMTYGFRIQSAHAHMQNGNDIKDTQEVEQYKTTHVQYDDSVPHAQLIKDTIKKTKIIDTKTYHLQHDKDPKVKDALFNDSRFIGQYPKELPMLYGKYKEFEHALYEKSIKITHDKTVKMTSQEDGELDSKNVSFQGYVHKDSHNSHAELPRFETSNRFSQNYPRQDDLNSLATLSRTLTSNTDRLSKDYAAQYDNNTLTFPRAQASNTDRLSKDTLTTLSRAQISNANRFSKDYAAQYDENTLTTFSHAQASNTDRLSEDCTNPEDYSTFKSLSPGFEHKVLTHKDPLDVDRTKTSVQYDQDSKTTQVNYVKDIRTITHEQFEFLKNSTKTRMSYNVKDLIKKDTKTTHAHLEDEIQRNSKPSINVQETGNETKVTPVLKGRPLSKKTATCICSFCSKSFATTRALELHVRRHSGLRPYPCKFCDKSFYQPSERAVHMRTHTGARPYRCPHCLKLFRYSGDLKQHINIHTGQRPYQCETCSKAFTNHSTLRQHKRIHSGERPYHCKDCGKTYRYHSSLKQHRTAHQKKAASQALNMTSSKTALTGNDVKVKKEKCIE